MSAKHTQGRLIVRGTRLHTTDTGIDCIATMQISNQPSWEEDAHRLVACWNACEGIADPENVIPRLLELNEINPVLSGQVATLWKKNAAMLAALVAIVEDKTPWANAAAVRAQIAWKAIAEATGDAA
jgi:hypothetical protein